MQIGAVDNAHIDNIQRLAGMLVDNLVVLAINVYDSPQLLVCTGCLCQAYLCTILCGCIFDLDYLAACLGCNGIPYVFIKILHDINTPCPAAEISIYVNFCNKNVLFISWLIIAQHLY